MFLTCKNLSYITNISHGFFGRKGGVSGGIFASLNCGARARDNRENVDENRRRVANALGTTENKLLCLMQTHSADVIQVESLWDMDTRPEADAMVTNIPGIALGILTADCVPVLFADKKNGIIGTAHAGWRGAFSGILENTLKSMETLGAERDSIACAIGPAIAQPSYEVSEDFRQTFINKARNHTRYFTPSVKPKHFMFNLKQFVYDSLLETGISDINMLENDTYIEEDAFFSYRRATHRGETDYGRQISAIILNKA